MRKLLYIIALLAVPMLASETQAQTKVFTYDWSRTFVATDTVGGGVQYRDSSDFSYVWDQSDKAFTRYWLTINVTGHDSLASDTLFAMVYHAPTKDGPWSLFDSVNTVLRIYADTIRNFTKSVNTDSTLYVGNFWKVKFVNSVKVPQALWAYILRQSNVQAHKIEFYWQGKY